MAGFSRGWRNFLILKMKWRWSCWQYKDCYTDPPCRYTTVMPLRRAEIELEDWQVVQMTYPDEYDYSKLSEYTLLRLANGYIEEPNTATLAMGELNTRKHPDVEKISLKILSDQCVDRYLVASALKDLADSSFEKAINYLVKHGTGKDIYLIKEVVEILAFVEEGKITSVVSELARNILENVAGDYQQFSDDGDFIRFSYEPFVERFKQA